MRLIFILPLLANLCFGQQRPSVLTDTNGVLLTPTNFFWTNIALINGPLNSYQTNRDYFFRTNTAAANSASNLFPNLSINGTLTGQLVKATNFSGVVGSLTNGGWTGGALTNATNFGQAFTSPGSAAVSEQFGAGATATAGGATAVGSVSVASFASATAVGNGASASALSSTAIGAESTASGDYAVSLGGVATKPNSSAIGKGSIAGHTNSTALGSGAATTANNQVMLGDAATGIDVVVSRNIQIGGNAQIVGNLTNAHFTGTNTLPAGSDLSFGRYAITSLANSNNAGIIVGTNVFIEVSGPSGAFNINGIAGGRDGKFIVIVNQTGQTMTLANESGVDPTAANRIRTGISLDVQITGNPGVVMLIYSGAASRWIMFNVSSSIASSAISAATANIGTLMLTNALPSTSVSFSVVQTNFVSGFVYTNFYGAMIEVSATAQLTEAAVAGTSTIELRAIGTQTNFFSLPTAIGAVTGSPQSHIAIKVPANGTYTFTNTSSGTGNSSTVVGGQITVY